MKKLLTLVVLLAVSTAAFAQVVPQDASYKTLKHYYSPKNYVKSSVDPYSTFWTGFESFFAPGTGQLIMKETGRGWAFIGGGVVIGIANGVVANKLVALTEKDASGNTVIPDANKDKAKGLIWGLLGTGAASLALDIWSCVDAVNIAKVKNQYYQDAVKKHAFSATVTPSVDLVQVGTSVTPTAGMTLAIRF